MREEGEWKHAAGSVPSDSSKFKMFKVEGFFTRPGGPIRSKENAGLQRPDPPVSMRSFEDTSSSEFSGSSAAGVQELSLGLSQTVDLSCRQGCDFLLYFKLIYLFHTIQYTYYSSRIFAFVKQIFFTKFARKHQSTL